MQIAISQQERLTQQLNLTPHLLQSIHILHLDVIDLYKYVMEEIESNPVIEFPVGWAPRACGCELIENLTVEKAPSLLDDLKFQLHMLSISKEDRKIGEYLLESLDDRGFLMDRPEDISIRTGWPLRLIKNMVNTIQTFEPYGVGASCMKECLEIQLRMTGQDTPLTMEVFNHYLKNLARNDLKHIAEKTGSTVNEIRQVLKILQNLNISPGDLYDNGENKPVVPEIIIAVEDDGIQVTLANELPPIRVNESYFSGHSIDKESDSFIHREYTKAKMLIQFISQRNSTLLKVAAFVANYQKDHFLSGSPPVPLTLETVAYALNMHTSTVCRTLNNRYYEFDKRVYSFKHHFPSRLKSGDSDAKIKAIIRGMIEEEDKQHPLSDQQITDILNQKSISIARRTVAKYREELRIIAAKYRKVGQV